MSIAEPPYFLTRPSDMSVLAGQDILLACQASGDPHPDIHWRRQDDDLDMGKIQLVHGKGLRIENVHPSDAGVYVCEASNSMGAVTAAASLTVSEPPVITVKPRAHLQVPVATSSSESVSLQCMVTGSPKPAVYWTLEEDIAHLDEGRRRNRRSSTGNHLLIMPGTRRRNMYVASDGALKIEGPSLNASGHYVCSAVNSVGAALARSHLVIYDFEKRPDSQSTQIYEQEGRSAGPASIVLEEARLALLERTVESLEAMALGPTALRVFWKLVAGFPSKFIEGFRVHYRPRRLDRYEQFEAATVQGFTFNHHTLQGLQEHVEYEVFVQPFFRQVVGLPSAMQLVKTHPARPSAPPAITEARLVNFTMVFVAWNGIEDEHHNGPLTGFQVRKKNQLRARSGL